MMNIQNSTFGVLALASAAAVLSAQSALTGLEFEAASIRPSPPPAEVMTVGCSGGPGSDDPTRLRCSNTDLGYLIGHAFELRGYEFNPPEWMSDQAFEVVANVPPHATKQQFLSMFQDLLRQRFNLTYHRADQRVQGFELLVANGGPKVARSAPRDSQDQNLPQPLGLGRDGYPSVEGTGASFMGHRARMRYHDQTMKDLARFLSGQLRAPVADRTGLDGGYDISLYWVTDASDEDGPTLLSALPSQLGLRLEAKRVNASRFVVDHADRKPSAN